MQVSEHRAQQLKALRQRLRRHPALWGDVSEAKEDQCARIALAIRGRLSGYWNSRVASILAGRNNLSA